jgi:hypothetical protein
MTRRENSFVMSYEEKFSTLIEMCQDAERNGVDVVVPVREIRSAQLLTKKSLSGVYTMPPVTLPDHSRAQILILPVVRVPCSQLNGELGPALPRDLPPSGTAQDTRGGAAFA